jgi:hypothetical protein
MPPSCSVSSWARVSTVLPSKRVVDDGIGANHPKPLSGEAQSSPFWYDTSLAYFFRHFNRASASVVELSIIAPTWSF